MICYMITKYNLSLDHEIEHTYYNDYYFIYLFCINVPLKLSGK